MIATITFFASFLGIIAMILLKARRLRLSVRSQFSFLSEKVDGKVRRVFHTLRTFFSYFNRKSAIALVHWIAYHVFALVRRAYLWTHKKAHSHPRTKKVIHMVQGKGEHDSTGGASFYLKRISEEE